jgi:hypothetical protein
MGAWQPTAVRCRGPDMVPGDCLLRARVRRPARTAATPSLARALPFRRVTLARETMEELAGPLTGVVLLPE